MASSRFREHAFGGKSGRALVSVVAIVGALTLAGCADEPDPAEAEASLCDSVDDLQSAVNSLVELDVSSATVSDADEAAATVREALEDVRSASEQSNESQISELETALGDLRTSIDDADGDQTLAGAAAQVGAAAQEVQRSFRALFETTDC